MLPALVLAALFAVSVAAQVAHEKMLKWQQRVEARLKITLYKMVGLSPPKKLEAAAKPEKPPPSVGMSSVGSFREKIEAEREEQPTYEREL